MQMVSRKLGEFFNIGRDRGWDVVRQVWTVHSLVDPEGRVLQIDDHLAQEHLRIRHDPVHRVDRAAGTPSRCIRPSHSAVVRAGKMASSTGTSSPRRATRFGFELNRGSDTRSGRSIARQKPDQNFSAKTATTT